MSMNTRAVMAGFAKLCPSPPNRHLTITTANAAPMTHCHTGTLVLRFSASRRPVTTALRSPTVCLRPVTRLNRNSETTAPITHAASTGSAFTPKMTTEATAAGSSAIITSSMMRRLESLVWIWGAGERIRFSIVLPPYFFSARSALTLRTKRFASRLFCTRGRCAGHT